MKKWFFKDEKIHWSELKRKKRPDPFSFSSKNAVSGGPQIWPGRIEKIDRLNLENAKSAFGGREQEFRAGIGGGPELSPNIRNKKINIEAVFHSFWETFLRRFFQQRRARFVAYHCTQFYHAIEISAFLNGRRGRAAAASCLITTKPLAARIMQRRIMQGRGMQGRMTQKRTMQERTMQRRGRRAFLFTQKAASFPSKKASAKKN